MNVRRRTLIGALSLALGGVFVVPVVATEHVAIADAATSTYKLAVTGMT